jgi:hypothetical protein
MALLRLHANPDGARFDNDRRTSAQLRFEAPVWRVMKMTLTLEQMKANRKLWVDALRSGKYQQTAATLMDGDGYCCLGIACVVAGVSTDIFGGFGNLHRLPEVKDFFGIDDADGSYFVEDGLIRSLAEDNDTGKSFAEIADIIESEPEGLFINPEA